MDDVHARLSLHASWWEHECLARHTDLHDAVTRQRAPGVVRALVVLLLLGLMPHVFAAAPPR